MTFLTLNLSCIILFRLPLARPEMALLGKFAVASATVTADSDDVEVYVIPITEMERRFAKGFTFSNFGNDITIGIPDRHCSRYNVIDLRNNKNPKKKT